MLQIRFRGLFRILKELTLSLATVNRSCLRSSTLSLQLRILEMIFLSISLNFLKSNSLLPKHLSRTPSSGFETAFGLEFSLRYDSDWTLY